MLPNQAFNEFIQFVEVHYPHCDAGKVKSLLQSNSELNSLFPFSITLDKESVRRIRQVCHNSYQHFLAKMSSDCCPELLPFDVRFDLSLNYVPGKTLQLNDIKIIELNASNPGFFWLSSIANRLFNLKFGLQDPNPSFEEVVEIYSKRIDVQRKTKMCFSAPYWLNEAWVDQTLRMEIMQSLGLECYITPFEESFYDVDEERSLCLYDQKGNQIEDIHLVYHPSVFSKLRFNVPFYEFNTPHECYLHCLRTGTLNDWNSSFCSQLSDKKLMVQLTESDAISNLAETFETIESIPEKVTFVWEKPRNDFGGNGVSLRNRRDIVRNNDNNVFQKHYPLPTLQVGEFQAHLLFTCSLTGSGETLFIGCRASLETLVSEKNDFWLPISLTD